MPADSVRITAEFDEIDYNITLTSTEGGTVSARSTANYNDNVLLSADPDDGWYLKEWQVVSGDVTVSPFYSYYRFTMPAEDVELRAVFAKVAHGVTVLTDGNGTASADKENAAEGETVTLTSTPNSGCKFKQWQVLYGDVQISGDTFTMSGDQVGVKAIFEPVTYPLAISYSDGGTARAYVDEVAAGTTVVIDAYPDSGWRLKEWQVIKGDTTVIGSEFVMPAEETELKAIFEKIPHTVTVSTDGNGTASADTASAVAGDMVALTAVPNSDYRLKGWQVISGDVTIENGEFTMPGKDVEIKAIFEKIPHTVTVTAGEGGTVYAVETCTAGESVQLMNSPDDGYIFKEWQVLEGNISINDNCFTMPAEDVSVKAVFEQLPTCDITITTDGNGTAESDVTSAYENRVVYLTATPDSGYRFKEWQVVSGSVTIQDNAFGMPGEDVAIKAIFEPVYSVTNDGNVNVYNWAGFSIARH